jgi:hypothetical protein
VRWQPGRDKIAELLEAAEFQQVAADHHVGQLLIDDAARHLATAAVALSSGDLSGAYLLATSSTSGSPRFMRYEKADLWIGIAIVVIGGTARR